MHYFKKDLNDNFGWTKLKETLTWKNSFFLLVIYMTITAKISSLIVKVFIMKYRKYIKIYSIKNILRKNVHHWGDFLIMTRHIFCSRFLLSICNFTVSLRRARECKNNPLCILIFPRPSRYQSCSRAAQISFLHNIRGYSRFYAFVVGNISKR